MKQYINDCLAGSELGYLKPCQIKFSTFTAKPASINSAVVIYTAFSLVLMRLLLTYRQKSRYTKLPQYIFG